MPLSCMAFQEFERGVQYRTDSADHFLGREELKPGAGGWLSGEGKVRLGKDRDK